MRQERQRRRNRRAVPSNTSLNEEDMELKPTRRRRTAQDKEFGGRTNGSPRREREMQFSRGRGFPDLEDEDEDEVRVEKTVDDEDEDFDYRPAPRRKRSTRRRNRYED